MIDTTMSRTNASVSLLLPTQLVFNIGFYAVVLPEHDPASSVVGQFNGRASAVGGAFTCLRDRRLVNFAAFFSVNLLAYNQLYFALPLELTQSGAVAGTLAVLFTLASVLTITFQMPLSAVTAKVGPAGTLGAGFGCIASTAMLPHLRPISHQKDHP